MKEVCTMAPRAENPPTENGRNGQLDGHEPEPVPYRLTPEREATLLTEAHALGDDVYLFPGKLARRVAWASRIQLTAERDAAELVKAPFPDDEPPLTVAEIGSMRDKIELLRVTQSRWTAVQRTQLEALASFEKVASEAGRHKQCLLRFFDLRFKSDVEGQRRLSDIRAGRGDADLVQDVSDLLVLAEDHTEAIASAPRGEAAAVARLRELSPMLSRLLADKALTPEAREARKLRDAAYTLVLRAERRIRAAAEYWYEGTDKLKPYAPYPTTATTGGAEEEEGDETTLEPSPPAEVAASAPPA
jgi:hypothetical protein